MKMYKYHFTPDTKHTVFIMYEEHNGYYLSYSYEDYDGSHVKSFVTCNFKDEVDTDVRQSLNYTFREKFDYAVMVNAIPDAMVEIACNAIDKYFKLC